MQQGLTVLSVGNGQDQMSAWVAAGYSVVTLDIDAQTNPDIVGDMTELHDIGPFDAVYSSHSLEHLYPHEVPRALASFYRVLKPGGICTIFVPDLEGVQPTDEPLDTVGDSQLTGLHLFYGDASQIEANPWMAHHSGFVEKTLRQVMEAAGFKVTTKRMSYHNLLGLGVK